MIIGDCTPFIFSSPFPSGPSPPQMIWEEQILETQLLERSNQVGPVTQLQIVAYTVQEILK